MSTALNTNQMTIEPTQIIRSTRKTLALIVKPDGSLIVRAPRRVSERSIREFIEQNRRWIEKKRAESLASPPPPRKHYVPGEKFLYLGTPYPLEIVKGQSQSLILDGTFRLSESALDEAALAFERWYRERARQVLRERVDVYAGQHGFQYKRMGITSARTRWGSCSASGALNFSWRLIQAPLEVVDYVVVHELVHTVFHNHSQRFWQRLGAVMPDYKEHRTWLRKHGRQLLG